MHNAKKLKIISNYIKCVAKGSYYSLMASRYLEVYERDQFRITEKAFQRFDKMLGDYKKLEKLDINDMGTLVYCVLLAEADKDPSISKKFRSLLDSNEDLKGCVSLTKEIDKDYEGLKLSGPLYQIFFGLDPNPHREIWAPITEGFKLGCTTEQDQIFLGEVNIPKYAE
jgi:hypothetical protein